MGLINETIKFTTVGTESITSATKKLDEMSKGLKMVVVEFGAVAAIGSAAMFKAIEASDNQINAEQRLQLSLKATGQATDEVQRAVLKQASEMQKMAGIADERLLPLYGRLNLATGDMNKTMALMPGIIDAAANSGKSVETVIQAMIMAYNGSTSSLRRYNIEVDAGSNKTKLFEQVLEQTQKFSGSAAISMSKLSGWIKAIKLAIDDTFEPLGQKLDEWFRPLAEKMYEIVILIQDFIKENSGLVAGLLVAGTAIAGVVASIAAAVLAVGAFITSWVSLSAVWAGIVTAIGIISTLLGTSLMPIIAAVTVK